tara:strand:+ start:480 stop:602 length:123 start_codon:yes stop_codon:yes gene_type:complete
MVVMTRIKELFDLLNKELKTIKPTMLICLYLAVFVFAMSG